MLIAVFKNIVQANAKFAMLVGNIYGQISRCGTGFYIRDSRARAVSEESKVFINAQSYLDITVPAPTWNRRRRKSVVLQGPIKSLAITSHAFPQTISAFYPASAALMVHFASSTSSIQLSHPTPLSTAKRHTHLSRTAQSKQLRPTY